MKPRFQAPPAPCYSSAIVVEPESTGAVPNEPLFSVEDGVMGFHISGGHGEANRSTWIHESANETKVLKCIVPIFF